MSRTIYVALAAMLVAAPAAAQQQLSYEGRPLSAWIKDLKAPAPQSRSAAAYAISGMGAAAKSAVPALIEALSDSEPAVRFPVCVALREIGPPAAAAVPKLQELQDNDRSDDVAFMAKKAIRAIKGETPQTAGP
jgi:HEAT repeat protein